MNKQTFKAAADIYRRLRKQGKTLKNAMDTYIAAVAIQHEVFLLHKDRDFDLIAAEYPLKAVPPATG